MTTDRLSADRSKPRPVSTWRVVGWVWGVGCGRGVGEWVGEGVVVVCVGGG